VFWDILRNAKRARDSGQVSVGATCKETGIQPISKEEIDTIARTIGDGPIGLAHHEPDDGAEAHRCFENATMKVTRDGGQVMFGWTFHSRLVENIPGPGYLFAAHHAVWHAPDGRLVDVTPHPDPKHRPLGPDGSILFLVDRNAVPVQTGNQVAPRPTRFFARDADPRLLTYVEELNRKENEACSEIYAQGDEASR